MPLHLVAAPGCDDALDKGDKLSCHEPKLEEKVHSAGSALSQMQGGLDGGSDQGQ